MELFNTNELQLRDHNPMVVAIGLYGDGKKCKHCAHCIENRPGAKSFLKCDLRKITNGAKTDIRANWNACSKFEPLT